MGYEGLGKESRAETMNLRPLARLLKVKIVGQWWRTPLIPALGAEVGFLKRLQKTFSVAEKLGIIRYFKGQQAGTHEKTGFSACFK